MDIFEKAILNFLKFVSSFTIAAGVLLAFINVVARFVFNKGIDWAFELTSYLFIYSAFFGAAYLFRTSEHIRVTLLVDAFSKFSKPIRVIADIITLIYLIIVSYYSYVFIFDPDLGLKASGEVSVDLEIEMWIIYLVVPISMAIAAILTFIKIIKGES